MAQDSRRVIIVGAGIGGLASAIALHEAGWQVQIFEQAERITPMGAALSIWPNAMTALDRLGCAEALRKIAAPLDQVTLADQSGRIINQMTISLPGNGAMLPTRTQLQSVLLSRCGDIPLTLGRRCTGHVQSDHGVQITLDNGQQHEADLLIAADGIWSPIAAAISGVRARHAGYGGALGISGQMATPLPVAAGRELWGFRERFGHFASDNNCHYWFYMRNEESAEQSAELAKRISADDFHGWPAEVAQLVAATPRDKIIPFSIHAKPPPTMLGKQRIILVGDAAHPMEPNLGQGACQAIEDAAALACAASGEISQILPRYVAMRLKRVRSFVALSHQGSMVSHRMPQWLQRPAHMLSRTMGAPFLRQQLGRMMVMPDYR